MFTCVFQYEKYKEHWNEYYDKTHKAHNIFYSEIAEKTTPHPTINIRDGSYIKGMYIHEVPPLR